MVNKFLTVTEAAERLGVSRQRVIALINQGKLGADRIGSVYMLKVKDVEKRISARMESRKL